MSLLQANVGRGRLLEYIQFVSWIRARLTMEAFWRNVSFTERVLQEISNDFVDTKPRDLKATFIICGQRHPRSVRTYLQKQAFVVINLCT